MPMDAETQLKLTIERSTRKTVDELRAMTLTEIRSWAEQSLQSRIKFRAHRPIVGRGSVLPEKCILSREAIDAQLEEALRK